MPHFLFVVDMPAPGISSEDPGAGTKWFSFEAKANAIALPTGARKLPCKNVWLFPAENSEQALRALANSADEQKLGHSTFLFSGDVTTLTKPAGGRTKMPISGA